MFRLVLLLMTMTALCSGCGLKGNLYLPDKSSEPVVITPTGNTSSSSSSSASSQVAP